MSRRRGSFTWLVALGLGVMLMASIPRVPEIAAQGDGCPEPNDDPATACPLTSGSDVQSVIDRPGDVDTYKLIVYGGGQVSLDLTGLPADYDLYLVDANGGVLGQSVHEGTAPEQLQLTVQPGTYYAVVQADPSRDVNPSQPYTLRLTQTGLAAPADSVVATRVVLLRDTFDDPLHGALPLSSRTPDSVEAAYIDGEYSIRNIDAANRVQGVYLPPSFDDATLAFDVRLTGATTGRRIVVECRHQPGGSPAMPSSYKLRVYPDSRQFEIVRADLGPETSLATRRTSTAIQPDNAWNHLELGCHGTAITARANGQQLGAAEDGRYRSGTLTITFGGPADEIPHVEARLDNLVVYGP